MFQHSRFAPYRALACFLLTVLMLSAVFSFGGSRVLAEEECGTNDLDCLNRKIEEYKAKIVQLQGEQQTLASTIGLLDSRISLMENEIQKTQTQIALLQVQIGELGVRIAGLEVSLRRVAEQLIERVRESYKNQHRESEISMLLSADFSTFLTRQKYARLSQNYTNAILREAEKQRLEFANEKELKEQKQLQVKQLQEKLAKQRDDLSKQKMEKNRVLLVTKNDEKRYQELLARAQAQKRAFGRFISSQGGASILSNQTKCDAWGCYYNQRDEKWGKMAMGNSNETMNQYGCLVTSMAMIATHYGKKLTPGDISASSNPFYLSTALMISGSWTVNGVTATRIRVPFSTSKLDEELNAGRPVIVGVYGGPDHFLVIKGKNDKGYVMHDPFPENGADKIFTDRYKISDINTLDFVRYSD